MSLKNLTFDTVKVKTSGGDLPVRGLSLENITLLVKRHASAATSLFNQFMETGAPGALENAATAGAILDVAPAAAAEVIVLGCGDELTQETVQIASRLSVSEQLELLEKIAELTFSREGGLKNVVAAVRRMMGSATTALASLEP